MPHADNFFLDSVYQKILKSIYFGRNKSVTLFIGPQYSISQHNI